MDGDASDEAQRIWPRWAHLEGCHVVVTTERGVRYAGLLTALDPESGAAALLSLPGPELRVVLGHSVSGIAPSGETAHESLLGAHKEMVLASDSPPPRRSSGPAVDPERVLSALRQMRISAARESDSTGQLCAISVLDGVARIVHPFRPSDCGSTNETVLARLQTIVRQVAAAEDV